MRIAICDDEIRFISDFTATMNRLYKSLDIIIDEFSNGEQLLHKFKQKHYDIIFLDIEMPTIDGISLAKKLRELREDVYIIFLTGHKEYSKKGYTVNALRYLEKPIVEEDIREVMSYIINKQNSENFLWVKTNNGEYKIILSDIIYFEAQDQKTIIYTVTGKYEIRAKLNDYEKRLKGRGFFRIHRSYMVSLSKIISMTGKNVNVMGEIALPIGRTKENEFRNAMMSFISDKSV